MKPRTHIRPTLAAALLLAGAGASCTGLEPAAIGAGASAAQTGVTFFYRGKARTFELAGYASVVEAVRRAGEMIGLSLVERSSDVTDDRTDGAGSPAWSDSWSGAETPDPEPPAEDDRARFYFRDERGQSIVVIVQRRTARATMIQTDVGVFGESGLGSLFLRQVFAELDKMDAYLDTWDRADPRGGGAGISGESGQ